ncbi:MAG: hypothetical protein ABI675_17465 [Chitinophagaceae bacterium]
MYKGIFFISFVILYVSLCVWGFTAIFYVEVKSLDAAVDRFLLLRILISIVTGPGLYLSGMWLFAPRYLVKWKGPFLGSLLIFLLSFLLSKGILQWYNAHIAIQNEFSISGDVTAKEIEKNSKGGRSYRIIVYDPSLRKHFYFKVKEEVYGYFQIRSPFKKQFRMGSLGVIYRRIL